MKGPIICDYGSSPVIPNHHISWVVGICWLVKAIAAASVETKSHVWVVQRAKNVEFFRKQIKNIQLEIQGIKT